MTKKKENFPVKVLVIVAQLNRGGLESRLVDILRNIDYERVQIDVFTYRMDEGAFDREVKALGSIIYYNKPLTVKNMFYYIKYFSLFLKSHPEYKIIHAHQDAWCSVFCKGAYEAGVPVRIAHSRTAISELSLKNIVKNIIKIPTRKYATHYFAVSELAGKWLFGEENFNNGRVKVWKNAIDCKDFRFDYEKRQELRRIFNLEDKKVIIHVGNFTPPKNQIFLLHVLNELLKHDKTYCIVFVGGETTAGLQKKAMQQAEAFEIRESVLFLGNRSDVKDLLQAGDIFCFPSLYEGLPGAVVEAQASGLPCVVSDRITKEIKVLDTTTMLSLEDRPEAWAKAIMKKIKEDRRDTYEDMVRAGFDIESLTEDLTKFYETVGRI